MVSQGFFIWKKVLKIDRPSGRRVRRFDGPCGPRVVVPPIGAMNFIYRPWRYGLASLPCKSSFFAIPEGRYG